MRDILNATTLRQLTFLEYLVSQEQWVTVDKVAEAIHCSARSLHSDIQVINQLYGPFRIEVSIKRGISLSYPPKYGIDFIYATVLETSPEFGLLEWLFWHESCQLDDLCRALFSSESTIKRMIRRINQVLLLRGLQISGPPYNMIGSEQSLRRFYSLYFSERYLGEVPLMTAEKRAVLNELIQMVTGILDVDCSTVNLNRVEVLISLIRYRNGYFTETECLSRANQERLKQLINEVMSSQGLVEHFQHQFQFEVTDGVLREVLMDYFNREYATSPTHLLTTLLKNPKVKAQVARMADFLVQLANQLAIELRDYQRLLVEFYNVMRGATSVSYILFDKKQQFLRQLKQDYPLLMEILVRELASFSFYEGFSWSQSFFNDVVYTLIINWPDLHRSLEKVFSTISIAIFCDDDVAYSHYLKELLVFKFGESIRIDLVAPSVKPCELDEWGDYDILVSNMSNVRITKGTFICLPAAPSTRDWQIIQHEISRLSMLKGGLSTKLMRF